MKKFLLPLSEYNRIYGVIHGVLRDIAQVERACIFFAICGSLILTRHYKIAARPIAGAFALGVSESDVIFFGVQDAIGLRPQADGFHMWVQTETHVIDFMAPIFDEAFAERESNVAIPRRMLQRRRAEVVASVGDLRPKGMSSPCQIQR